jgi:hypothetical protein
MPMAIGAGVPLERMTLKSNRIASALKRVSAVLAEVALPTSKADAGHSS